MNTAKEGLNCHETESLGRFQVQCFHHGRWENFGLRQSWAEGETQAWGSAIVEWPTKRVGARQHSWFLVTVWRRKMLFQTFGKEIRGLGSRTKKYKNPKHDE